MKAQSTNKKLQLLACGEDKIGKQTIGAANRFYEFNTMQAQLMQWAIGCIACIHYKSTKKF